MDHTNAVFDPVANLQARISDERREAERSRRRLEESMTRLGGELETTRKALLELIEYFHGEHADLGFCLPLDTWETCPSAVCSFIRNKLDARSIKL